MKIFLAAVILMSVLIFGGMWGFKSWENSQTINAVKQSVLSELVSPATAKFSDAKIEKIREGRTSFVRVTGAVDSQNRSGGFVRSVFEAKVLDSRNVEDLKIIER